MNLIPHPWNLTPNEAIQLQKQLAAMVDTTTPIDIEKVKFVAGVDVSVKDNISRSAIVVMSFPELEIVERSTAKIPTPFPYISGLLSFREGTVILQAYEKLNQKADVYIFDGQGIAHPRRIGIASHIGLWLDAPTIGCGKTLLTGRFDLTTLPETPGSFAYLIDKGQTVGMALRTKLNVSPVYISVGHKATLDTAHQLIMRTVTRYRLPEPIRAAHNTAGDYARSDN